LPILFTVYLGYWSNSKLCLAYREKVDICI